MKSQHNVSVTGQVVVRFEVELPVDHAKQGVTTPDPAVEAVLCALDERVSVFLWGQDKPPAMVHLESTDEDVTIEEDNRK